MRDLAKIRFALFVILTLQLGFWCAASKVYAQWDGVPPVPSRTGAIALSLGDPEFSYRFLALSLQNFGEAGIHVTPLKGYNYERLGQWFSLLDSLDPLSDHVPMLAAYYFGSTRVPEDAAVIVRYLAAAGQSPVGEKWRWLAHAAYLAQHRMNDTDLALTISYKLVRMHQDGVDMPQWAWQMPAFILTSRGDKAAARHLTKNMLVTQKNIAPAELNFMTSYLIDDLGADPDEVKSLLRMREEKSESGI